MYRYDRSKTASRNFTDAERNAAVIAYEVVADGKCEGWIALDEKQARIAARVEGILAYFIGYVDDICGGWARKIGGSKFFARTASVNG